MKTEKETKKIKYTIYVECAVSFLFILLGFFYFKQSILLVTGLSVLILTSIRYIGYIAVRKDRANLDAFIIDNTDERIAFIRQKAALLTLKISFCFIIITGIITHILQYSEISIALCTVGLFEYISVRIIETYYIKNFK